MARTHQYIRAENMATLNIATLAHGQPSISSTSSWPAQPMTRPAHGQHRPFSAHGQARRWTLQPMTSLDHGQTIPLPARPMASPPHCQASPLKPRPRPAHSEDSPAHRQPSPVHGLPRSRPARPISSTVHREYRPWPITSPDHGKPCTWTAQLMAK